MATWMPFWLKTITEAGSAALALVRQNGWIRCLRTEASLREKITTGWETLEKAAERARILRPKSFSPGQLE